MLPGAIMAATIVPIVARVGVVALLAIIVALVSMILRRMSSSRPASRWWRLRSRAATGL